jgi:transcriptional regulator with XRE-family HTH domain
MSDYNYLFEIESRKKEIGHRIKEERNKARLTQEELRQAMGIGSRQTVIKLESGTAVPSIDHLVKLCSKTAEI